MDSQTETTFLLEIEKIKSTISIKDNSKKARDKKISAWKEVKDALHVKCGKEFDERQLSKKWSNLQERLKSKLRQRNLTGGGTSADLNTRDEITHRILGDVNPMLVMVSGAWPSPPPPPPATPKKPSGDSSVCTCLPFYSCPSTSSSSTRNTSSASCWLHSAEEETSTRHRFCGDSGEWRWHHFFPPGLTNCWWRFPSCC